jgi:hypothetical protein
VTTTKSPDVTVDDRVECSGSLYIQQDGCNEPEDCSVRIIHADIIDEIS